MMMMEKDQDLGLSLSLSSGPASCARLVPPQLAVVVMPSSSSSSSASPPFHPFPYTSSTSLHPKPHWSDLLLSHPDKIRPIMGTPLLRGIDVNQAPSSAAAVGERGSEEDGGSSSPNNTVSSVSGATKRSGRDPPCASDELDAERASSRGPASDEEDGDGCRKKLRLSKDQSAVLEESFKEHSTLNPKQKMALAKRLNLRPRQVEVWFQNRRARTKLKQTEVDCEFLKRCCESLTEENRRLQKEVMELRALKLSPQLYMHMTPPTTLTMCPSCERVSNSSGAGAGPSNSSQPVRAASTAPSPLQQLPEQQNHQFLHHRRLVSPAPWAPVRLRPAFVDAPPQIS